MASRRNRLLALGVAVLAAVLVFALVLSNGDGRTPERQARSTSTTPPDPHAADRAAIQRNAVAYQEALRPASAGDPCRYVSELVRRAIASHAPAGLKSASCAEQARQADADALGEQLGEAQPLGVTNIEFGPFADSRKGADASAHWRDAEKGRVLFVRRDGQWLIGGG